MPPGTCESGGARAGTLLAETDASGEPTRWASYEALERGALARAEKGALKEGRIILFGEQSGFYLLPTVTRTYAPIGQTPVLHEQLSRDHLSVISGISPEGKLYVMEQERSLKSQDKVRFLRHLLRQIEGKLLMIWDGSPRYIAARRSRTSLPAGRPRG